MDKKLFKSILLIITYAVVLVVVLARLNVIGGAVMWALGLIKPLLIGFAIAFVLNRPCHFFNRLYLRGLGEKNRKVCRALAVVSSYVALLVVASAIFAFVLPKLVHISQAGDGWPWFVASEHIQRRDHRVWIGVVAIVDQETILCQRMHFHAAGRQRNGAPQSILNV